MTTFESTTKDAVQARRNEQSRLAGLRREPSARTVALVLATIALLPALARLYLVRFAHAPTVFSDELSYSKLALSLGKTGHFALFSQRGFSYSPLYPLVISPIYALGASTPTAYALIKVVNVLLMSLAVVPTYKIARFVLPRRPALLVAALSAALPLLSYASFVMSENLGYTACLFSIWAMLAALRNPGVKTDALVLLSIAAATLARIQLVVLIPVAVTAILLAEVIWSPDESRLGAALRRALRKHVVLFAAVGVGLLGVALVALSGRAVFSLAGSYAAIGARGFPNFPHFLKVLVEHAADLEFAVGVVPFVGTLVAAYVFARLRDRRRYAPFAAVAVSLTVWLLLETAFQAAQFDGGPAGSVPRIHERFFIYVAPLFLVGVVAAWRASARAGLGRIHLAAAGAAVLLALLVPYGSVINNTVAVDSFGLQLFARVRGGELGPFPHPTLVAVWVTGTLALLYYYVRTRLRSVLLLVLAPFLFIWVLETDRIDSASSFARSQLPAHSNWVDRTHPVGGVALITADTSAAGLQTAFANMSISRVYYICEPAFGGEFGEQELTIGGAGRLQAADLASVRYVVAPSSLRIRGRVVARNRPGKEVLVAPSTRQVRAQPTTVRRICAAPRRISR